MRDSLGAGEALEQLGQSVDTVYTRNIEPRAKLTGIINHLNRASMVACDAWKKTAAAARCKH